MAYGDFNHLNRRAAVDKVLHDEAFNIAKNSKYDEYQRGLTLMVYKFFVNKTFGRMVKNENISGEEVAKELHRANIRKFNKRKVCGVHM